MKARTFLHPAFDYLVIGGGFSLLVSAATFTPLSGLLNSAVAPSLTLLLFTVNLTHFASSTVRLYAKPRAFDQHAFLTMGLPLATLAAVALAIVFAEDVGSHIGRLYLTWSPYHYAAQAYGLSLMYCYRSGTKVDDVQRLLLRAACLCPFLWAFLNGSGAGIDWLLPWRVLADQRVVAARAAFSSVFQVAAVALPLLVVARGARRGQALPLISLLIMASNAVWWLVLLPKGLFGWASIFHGLQYLAIVTIFHVQDRVRLPGNSRPPLAHAAAFLAACLVLAYLLFRLWPYAFVSLGFTTAESMMIVIASINIHHFLVDGFIWRLRRNSNYQTVSGDASASGLEPALAS